MTKNSSSESLTVRCPSQIVDSINQQVKQTSQNKTDVVVGMLSNSIPSLHITERAKLPPNQEYISFTHQTIKYCM